MTARGHRGVVLRRVAPLALMPAAAFVVHQLRFWLAFGGRATAWLQVQGHAYLHSLGPWIALLIAFSVGVFVRALGRALAGQRTASRFTISFVGLWLTCAIALVGIYICQELLEGVFLSGHPAGLAGVFGYGGWWAVPAAFAVGLVLAAVFHGARWVLAEVTERFGAWPTSRRRTGTAPLPRSVSLLCPAPLAGGWSGRGPPFSAWR